MKITYKHLDDLYRAYAASAMLIDGELCALIASEEKGYPCYLYSGKDFETRSTVWEEGGGCMSIIPIPDKENEFLAIVDFYLKESPSKAKLIWGCYREGAWTFKDVVSLPYLHRFDIYQVGSKLYLMCATIADDKNHKEDWSRPGSVYYGVLPENLEDGVELDILTKGYFRNHGYYRREINGQIFGYFTSDEGVFRIIPHEGKPWQIEKILDGAVGEIACLDLNGDGVDELITIEPFHGNMIRIYEKINESYQVVYTYPYDIDFAHTLVGDYLGGVPTFVGGIRRKNADLFYIQYNHKTQKYEETIIDAQAGPANLVVAHQKHRDIIVSANHTRNEAAVYIVEEGS